MGDQSASLPPDVRRVAVDPAPRLGPPVANQPHRHDLVSPVLAVDRQPANHLRGVRPLQSHRRVRVDPQQEPAGAIPVIRVMIVAQRPVRPMRELRAPTGVQTRVMIVVGLRVQIHVRLAPRIRVMIVVGLRVQIRELLGPRTAVTIVAMIVVLTIDVLRVVLVVVLRVAPRRRIGEVRLVRVLRPVVLDAQVIVMSVRSARSAPSAFANRTLPMKSRLNSSISR